MKKLLTRISSDTYFFRDGVKVLGVPEGISGNLTNIRGDLSGISGDLTSISGDLSGIRGNLSGIRGNLTGIYGDLDTCSITTEERDRGIQISELISEQPTE